MQVGPIQQQYVCVDLSNGAATPLTELHRQPATFMRQVAAHGGRGSSWVDDIDTALIELDPETLQPRSDRAENAINVLFFRHRPHFLIDPAQYVRDRFRGSRCSVALQMSPCYADLRSESRSPRIPGQTCVDTRL